MVIDINKEYFNPQRLYEYLIPINRAIEELKKRVKRFYFILVLSTNHCPKCSGKLEMINDSKCYCLMCSFEFDPTIAFQRCPECDGELMKKTYHYYCKNCGSQVYSRYCFEENVFNSEYFAEMMRKSREKKDIQNQTLQRLILRTRSDVYVPKEEIKLSEIDGLINTLDSLDQLPIPKELIQFYLKSEEFNMEKYKNHILTSFQGSELFFDEIPALLENYRKDRIFRFIALIFMNHFNEVVLVQYNNTILVKKVEPDQ